jgi:hypothetical protein
VTTIDYKLATAAAAEYRKSLGLILTRPYVAEFAPVSSVIQPYDVGTQQSAAAAQAANCLVTVVTQMNIVQPPWLVRAEIDGHHLVYLPQLIGWQMY